MSTAVNQIVLSGEVRKVFGHKLTVQGMDNYSFAVKYHNGERENQVVVNAYGQLAKELEESPVDEGDFVLVAGKLAEIRWQDKETEEWNGRHDIYPTSVVNLSDLEGGALDD